MNEIVKKYIYILARDKYMAKINIYKKQRNNTKI